MNAHLTTLGIGALVVVLQLCLAHRCSRTRRRGVATATASLGVLICVALLETGHQAQRMRPAKPETFEASLLRYRAAVVSVESGGRGGRCPGWPRTPCGD